MKLYQSRHKAAQTNKLHDRLEYWLGSCDGLLDFSSLSHDLVLVGGGSMWHKTGISCKEILFMTHEPSRPISASSAAIGKIVDNALCDVVRSFFPNRYSRADAEVHSAEFHFAT